MKESNSRLAKCHDNRTITNNGGSTVTRTKRITNYFLYQVDEKNPLRKIDEQIIFGSDEHFGKSMNDFYKEDIKQSCVKLSQEEVIVLFKLRDATMYHSKDYYAIRNKIVEAYLTLVVIIAKQFTDDVHLLQDYIQAGNIGLLKAAEKYNIHWTTYFSSYAARKIRWAILNFMKDTNSDFSGSSQLGSIEKYCTSFYMEYGKKPSIEEIRTVTGFSTFQIKSFLRSMETVSLNDTPSPDGFDFCDMQSSDYLEDLESDESSSSRLEEIPDLEENTEEKAIHHIENDPFQIAKGLLTLREYQVITDYFGYPNRTPMTLDQISQKFGVHRERIRQIKAKAIRKLFNNSIFKSYFCTRQKGCLSNGIEYSYYSYEY